MIVYYYRELGEWCAFAHDENEINSHFSKPSAWDVGCIENEASVRQLFHSSACCITRAHMFCNMYRVGWIGAGIMGTSMCGHILVRDRTMPAMALTH